MRTIPVALVQFDSLPEQTRENLDHMEGLTERAARSGARWVFFHENTVSDYSPNVKDIAEEVPNGPSTQRMAKLARGLNCYISFGLSEARGGRYHISQVFVGPEGFVYCYRKTWLWLNRPEIGYRNEWARYDPGEGPELFQIDGVKATCFICADGAAPRCIERAAALNPQVVFYANNRWSLHDGFEEMAEKARKIKAVMLVTNRVGLSWKEQCEGGSAVYSKAGEILANANANGEEEILLHSLILEAT
jgi:predicted amidohydrolase